MIENLFHEGNGQESFFVWKTFCKPLSSPELRSGMRFLIIEIFHIFCIFIYPENGANMLYARGSGKVLVLFFFLKQISKSIKCNFGQFEVWKKWRDQKKTKKKVLRQHFSSKFAHIEVIWWFCRCQLGGKKLDNLEFRETGQAKTKITIFPAFFL